MAGYVRGLYSGGKWISPDQAPEPELPSEPIMVASLQIGGWYRDKGKWIWKEGEFLLEFKETADAWRHLQSGYRITRRLVIDA